jgi:hypothetical protein
VVVQSNINFFFLNYHENKKQLKSKKDNAKVDPAIISFKNAVPKIKPHVTISV